LKFISRYISKVYSDFYISYLNKHNVLNVKSCFDIGSSAGVFVDELNQLGIVTEGLEPNTKSIQSKKVKKGTFDLNYTTDKKYDLITLPQVIYFLGDFESICKKIKMMLNSDGVIFIVSEPIEFEGPITYTNTKTYPLHTETEYKKIFDRLELEILDFSTYQSNIGIAFNQGKLKAILRLFLFMTGLRNSITENSNGNHLYILLKSKT
jgi:predicted TPR repeat methyltransferase